MLKNTRNMRNIFVFKAKIRVRLFAHKNMLTFID